MAEEETLTNSGGARGNRTPDLYNAIVALSQLSYDPLDNSQKLRVYL
jgi:hypothetical protein